MELQEFLTVAKEEFGDKIHISGLGHMTDEDIDKLNGVSIRRNLGRNVPTLLTREKVDAYPQKPWVVLDDKDEAQCVKCDQPLGMPQPLPGGMGTFEWGIRNGMGTCLGCGTEYQLYHRPMDGRGVTIIRYALAGFSRG